jgi:hypothetical protein
VSVSDIGVADVQAAALAAVRGLVSTSPDRVVVIGEAPTAGDHEGSWDWHGFGLPARAGAGPALPRALGVGAWLLDAAGWDGDRRYVGVPVGTPPERCAELGRALGEPSGRLAVLAVADGSARRTLKAPGHLDERAAAFDDRLAAALQSADLEALASVDADLAAELMAAGRATLQVLAGLAAGSTWTAELLCHDAPYGVAWFVARWDADETS